MDTRAKKLIFRAHHRGFKEADLLLGGFADAEVAGMSEAELARFEALLSLPDQEIYAWITGQKPVPEEIDNPILDRLRQFSYAKRPMGE